MVHQEIMESSSRKLANDVNHVNVTTKKSKVI